MIITDNSTFTFKSFTFTTQRKTSLFHPIYAVPLGNFLFGLFGWLVLERYGKTISKICVIK